MPLRTGAIVMFTATLAIAGGPSFDVASIKPAAIPIGREGGNRSRIEHTPTSLTMSNISLAACVQWAYDVRPFQISDPHALPGSFDILAKTTDPVILAQLKAMLQDLLAKRFHLAIHRETRSLPVYELVVAKGGPKLPPPNNDSSIIIRTESLPRVQSDSFVFHDVTLPHFAEMLSQLRGIDLPIVDRSGITGYYDIVLKSAPAAAREGDTAALFNILQQQTGLKLSLGKAPFEVIVIDHSERPSEN
jgi:uncharacterized protein (TIGR03435 family)